MGVFTGIGLGSGAGGVGAVAAHASSHADGGGDEVSLDRGVVIHVVTAADLPAAVGGVRTLVSGRLYKLYSSIDLGADVLAANGDVVIAGHDRLVCGFATASASPLISMSGGSVQLRGLTLANTSGKCFAYNGASGKLFTIDECVFVNAVQDTAVGAAGALGFLCRDSRWGGGGVAGVEVSGNFTAVRFGTVAFIGLTGANERYFEIASGSTFGSVHVHACLFSPALANQTAVYVDAGVVPTDGGAFNDNTFTTTGTILAGVSEASEGWAFEGNSNIRDSAAVGRIYYSGNAVETVINDTATFYEVATGSAFLLSAEAERMSLVSNRLQYNGDEAKKFVVDLSAIMFPASGTNLDFEVRVRHFDASAGTTSTVGAAVPAGYKSVPIATTRGFLAELDDGDQLFFEVRNTTNTTNLVVSSCSLRAAAIG